MGALGDSFYEYLLKEWLRSGKTDNIAKEMFDQAATDVENELVKTSASGLIYFAEQKYGKLEHKMDHLACFGGKFCITNIYMYSNGPIYGPNKHVKLHSLSTNVL